MAAATAPFRDTPAKWTSTLRKFLTADAIAASNSIEGFRVSTVDVVDLMEGEHDVDVSEENLAETVAYQHMMTYIQTLHDAPDFAYSQGLLNALHWMLQGHRHSPRKPPGSGGAGRCMSPTRATRPSPRTRRPTPRGPGADGRARRLAERGRRHARAGAGGDGAPDLVSIHPWADGNGRMSRSLQTLLIAREGVLAPEFSSIEAWLGRPGNTWEYYRELASRGATYQPEQDVSSWVRFNLVAYHQQAQAVRHRVDRSGRLGAAGGLRRDRRLDERVVPRCTMWPCRPRPEAALRARRGAQPSAGPARPARPGQRQNPRARRRTRARYYPEGPRFPEAALAEARGAHACNQPFLG